MFLEPLMDDMQKLWEYGVTLWDEYNRQHFNLNAIIFYMINDNPAHLSPTGHVKGKMGCVVCVDQMESIYLPSSSKPVYVRHRRFLTRKHKYHQWRTQFDGMTKNKEAPKHQDGNFMFEMIKNINVVFGKLMKRRKSKKNENSPKDSLFMK
jgi:hypothetical protein